MMENDINDYRTDCIKGHTCIKNLTQLVASATNAFKNIISSILRVVVHDHLGVSQKFFYCIFMWQYFADSKSPPAPPLKYHLYDVEKWTLDVCLSGFHLGK